MLSELSGAISPNLRSTIDNLTGLHATQHAKPDTRRFASIFFLEAPEAVCVGCGDTTHEEHDDSGNASRWQLIARLDNSASATKAQVTSVASVDERPTPSKARQTIASYHTVQGDRVPECSSTEINEFSQTPDDRRSIYTVTTSVESTMDMMWKPKPKIHMRHTDQMALIQAQSQAIAMMHNAGLKPTNKIQCRRRGCADILPGVEALKYHIHIHNIADVTAKYNDVPPFAASEPSLVQLNTSSAKTSHSRSKSTLGIKQKCSTTYPCSRKLSAGSLFPPHLSPRENVPDAQNDVPSLMAVAKSFVSDLGQSKSVSPLSVCNDDESSFMQTSTPSRGRRARKGSRAASDGPSIVMLLSPPSSPNLHDRLMFTSPAAIPLSLNPAVDDEDNRVVTPNEDADRVPEKLTGSRSPVRALSPTRVMSPIRNGIRRVLSIGCFVDSKE